MTYHLDTNVVVDVLRSRPGVVRERLRMARLQGIAISSIVLFELWNGVVRSGRRAENTKRLEILLAGEIDVLPFDGDDATHAGEIRALLERDGQGIGPYDVLIAAQALRAGATLVTANTREFARVQGLRCEDWRRRVRS